MTLYKVVKQTGGRWKTVSIELDLVDVQVPYQLRKISPSTTVSGSPHDVLRTHVSPGPCDHWTSLSDTAQAAQAAQAL